MYDFTDERGRQDGQDGHQGGQDGQGGAWLTCRSCVQAGYIFRGPRADWRTEYTSCQAFGRMLTLPSDDIDAVHWCKFGVPQGGRQCVSV